jgi:hypothetical protein
MRKLLLDKLITDFTALQFDSGSSLFTNMKKFYRASSMQGGDGLLLADQIGEDIKGVTTTQREYGFVLVHIESMEGVETDADAAIRIDRQSEVETTLLDYLQKEPNNLRTWGNTNGIEVVKIRIGNGIYLDQKSESGQARALVLRFKVIVDINNRNL